MLGRLGGVALPQPSPTVRAIGSVLNIDPSEPPIVALAMFAMLTKSQYRLQPARSSRRCSVPTTIFRRRSSCNRGFYVWNQASWCRFDNVRNADDVLSVYGEILIARSPWRCSVSGISSDPRSGGDHQTYGITRTSLCRCSGGRNAKDARFWWDSIARSDWKCSVCATNPNV